MDGRALLESDFKVTDGRLEPAQLNELSTAAELLRTPVPREFLAEEHAPRRVGGATRQLTTKDRLQTATALRTARSRHERAVAKRNERMRGALKIAEGLIESSEFDLSVLSVYLQARIEVDGLVGVRFSLLLLTKMLGDPWDELWAELEASESTASDGKGQRIRGAKRWLAQLDAVFDRLCTWCALHPEARRQVKSHPAGSAADEEWRLGTAHERLAAALERRRLTPRRWSDVSALLRDLEQSAAPAEDERPESETANELETTPMEVPAVSEVYATSAAASEAPRSGTHRLVVEGEATLRVSPQFVLLTQRLSAFSELLRDRQYARASLVAVDLQRTLESFDVAAYFPDLFAEFFVGCAEHAAELAQFGASPDDPGWHALNRLYQTDLPRFLKLRSSDGSSRPSLFARSSADGGS